MAEEFNFNGLGNFDYDFGYDTNGMPNFNTTNFSNISGAPGLSNIGISDSLPITDYNTSDISGVPAMTPWQQYTAQHEAEYNIPEQDKSLDQWWDRNSSGQLGVDNAFRLGQVGLAGLGIFSNIDAQNKARRAHQAALNFLESSRDPNSGYYREELSRMMRDPNGYLTDVNTQNKTNAAREAMMRQNALQGRGELNADQIRTLQDVASGAYRDRIETLLKLQGKDDLLNRSRAELMARAPTPSTLGAVLPGLANIFNVGQEYAVSEGYSSDPATRTASGRARAAEALRQERLANLSPDVRTHMSSNYPITGVKK